MNAVTQGSQSNALSNAERQRRWRARHPQAVAMQKWRPRFVRLLFECPEPEVMDRIRRAADAALRGDRQVTP